MADDTIPRLKRLVVAKDGQIQALSSRIEVLTDDLSECRSERDYAMQQVVRLQEIVERCQRESESHAMRAQRFEDELAAAQARAVNAEATLAASQETFAEELKALKGLAASESEEARPQQQEPRSSAHATCSDAAEGRPEVAPTAPKEVDGDTFSDFYNRLPPWGTPSPQRADGEAEPQDKTDPGTSRTSAAELRIANMSLRLQVESLTQAHRALHDELDRLSDELIEQTENDLQALSTRPRAARAHAESASATPAHAPCPSGGAKSDGPPSARFSAPSPLPELERACRADGYAASGEAEERLRWAREVQRRSSRTVPPRLASEADGYSEAHRRVRPGIATSTATFGTTARSFYSAAGRSKAEQQHLLRSKHRAEPSVGTVPLDRPCAKWSGRASPPLGAHTASRHAHPSYAEQELEKADAEKRVREQLTALMVAKEIALSAVAEL